MKTDVTNKDFQGKVNVRRNDKREKSRLRFNTADDDQVKIVLSALKKARAEAETKYDMVALTCICQQYLSCR